MLEFLSRFSLFRPKQSIILFYDHLDEKGLEIFEEQVTEVVQYFRPARVTEIAQRARKNEFGFVGIAFRHARKSALMKGLPLLRGRDIPATIYLQPDCVGTNLPIVGETPVPIEKQDPLAVYTTWKKLLEFSKSELEIGVWHSQNLKEELAYVKKQWGAPVKTLFKSQMSKSPPIGESYEGIECALTDDLGAVEKKTDPMRLPHYVMERTP